MEHVAIEAQPLVFYSEIALKGSKSEFIERFPDPALLLAPFQAVEEDLHFDTLKGKHLGRGVPTVLHVRKREGANAFQAMITVGRASNNDVVVSAETVSKFHGYFTTDPGGGMAFTDGNSTGGTTVDGAQLERGAKHPIPFGTTLCLGSLEATFLSAAQLYERACERDTPD